MLYILRLVWDSWNVAHITLHGVTQDEVEEVCHNDPLVQIGKKGRLLVIGLNQDTKMLTVILDQESLGVYYPVTARTASKKERKLYNSEEVLEE